MVLNRQRLTLGRWGIAWMRTRSDMTPRVYLDSTVFSFYHDTRPLSAQRRAVTVEWWDVQRDLYEVYTSHFAVDEVCQPSYPNRNQVAALARSTLLLPMSEDIEGIIAAYLHHQLMPRDDAGDAAHLAMASYHAMDYLATWNCRHLANVNKVDHIRRINLRLGLVTPEIVTPEQLLREV
jgi:hypothetical protein